MSIWHALCRVDEVVFRPVRLVHCKTFGHFWPRMHDGVPRNAKCLRCGKRYGGQP